MKIVGLDLSLRSTGVCIYNGQGLMATHVIESAPMADDMRRLDTILLELCDFILEHVGDRSSRTDLVVMEGLSMGPQAGRAFDRTGLHYLVRHMLWAEGISVVTVPPSTLKKYITGSGKAQKDHMLMEVSERFGVKCKTNDEADAVGLCVVGRALIAGLAPTCKPQHEVLAMLRKKYPDLKPMSNPGHG